MSGCPFSGAAAAVAQESLAQTPVSRRRVLVGAAGLAAVPVLSGIGAPTAAAQVVPTPVATPAPAPTPAASAALAKLKKGRALKGAHAVGDPRGADIARPVRPDREARFGLMFKRLPAFAPTDGLLTALAMSMNDGKAPLSDVKDSDVAFDNAAIPAGYIYFGQFVDHDMTLDKTPLTNRLQDPLAMRNYDTPWFDLGSVYGKGIKGSPELYDQDPARNGYLKVWHARRPGRPAPRRRRRRLPRRPAQRREPHRRPAAHGVHPAAQQASWTGQDLRPGPAADPLALPVADRQRLPAAHRRQGRREQPDQARRHRTIKFTGTFYKPEHLDKPVHADRVLRRRLPLRAQHDPRRVRDAGRAHRADLRPGRLRGPARQPADPGEPLGRLELLLRDPRPRAPRTTATWPG